MNLDNFVSTLPKSESATTEKNIIVYQMGKVGSSTVYFSLKNGLKMNNDQSIVAPTHNRVDDTYPTLPLKIYHGHLYSDFSRTFKERIKRGENVVITLFRDPISRNISQFFESPSYGLNSRKNYDVSSNNVKNIIDRFVSGYNHLGCLSWFKDELERIFKYNILTQPFNHKDGYVVTKEGKNTFIVLKLEKLNETLPIIAKEVLDIGDFSMVQDNITSEKPHNGNLYKEVKKNLKLPSTIIDEIYGDDYVKYFYTDEEIESLKTKWSR